MSEIPEDLQGKGAGWYVEEHPDGTGAIYDGSDFSITDVESREPDEELQELGYNGVDVAIRIARSVNAFDTLLAVAKLTRQLYPERPRPHPRHDLNPVYLDLLDAFELLDTSHPGWREWR